MKRDVDHVLLGGVEDDLDRDPAKLEAELADASPGVAYMRGRQLERLRSAALTRLVDECVSHVHARVSALAVEARLSPPQDQEATGYSTPMVLNGAYLLE